MRVVGMLGDGTPYFAPAGEMLVDGVLVTCHLCGRAFRSVAAHLASHGWTKEQYCAAFGLERGQPLEGTETRKLRAASLSARLLFDPAMRQGSQTGRERARRGELTRAAAAAARGRPFPEQRRRKAARAAALASRAQTAQANRDRASQHLAAVAAEVADGHGYPDLGAFVRARLAAGDSLAAISRAAGLHKDWLSRHLGQLDPAVAAMAREQSARRADVPWLPAVRRLGFADVRGYLWDRHHAQHRTVRAIAAEAGFSTHSVEAALRRHGLEVVAHATKRHAAQQRAAEVAAALGYASLASYIRQRRRDGWTWDAIAAESGQPPTWLRRQAAAQAAPNAACPDAGPGAR
jgi:lambda repressor-like predicted transcriptional regulator